MRFDDSIEVSATPATVFDTYADVEHWPSWTGSVTSVEKIDPGPLKVGLRVRIRQPRLPDAVWQVTGLVPGQEFTWESRRRGVRTVGIHRVVPAGAGSVRVTAVVEHSGPLAWLVGLLTARITRRYLRTEVEGLKAYCET